MKVTETVTNTLEIMKNEQPNPAEVAQSIVDRINSGKTSIKDASESDSKWFYPHQKKAKDYLHKKYETVTCNYQDVCETTVHENFTCYKEGKSGIEIHVIYHFGGLIKFYSQEGFLTTH